MADPVASTDGTRIAVWRSGRGRPLVLVHGTTADHTRWAAMLPRLDPHAEVVTMDRRGRGESGDEPPYAVEREYEDVAAVVDAEAARWGGPVDVLGHSFGALCALEAARRTANVRRLILYEPVVDAPPSGFADAADALLSDGRREEVVVAFFRDVLDVPGDALARLQADPAWRVRVAAAHTIPREDRAETAYRFDPTRFAVLRVPTLMLLGTESDEVFRRSTEAVAGALPDVRVQRLEGQGHFAVVTAPGPVAEAVVAFLGQDNAAS